MDPRALHPAYLPELADGDPNTNEDIVRIYRDRRRLLANLPRTLAHPSRIQRTVSRRKRTELGGADKDRVGGCAPLGVTWDANIMSTTTTTMTTVTTTATAAPGTWEMLRCGSGTGASTEEEEEKSAVGIDEGRWVIPEESHELLEPKVESPGEDSTMALIENHPRSVEPISQMAVKRPRGRPRKHPVVLESTSKVAKGRSKTGCITCRKRKKKCDETKPRCINCEKNAVVCEGYPERSIWKSGKEKADEAAQLSRVCIPKNSLQPVIHGVETTGDRIFFEHYVFRLSSVLTVEGPEKNAFKDMLLPMAVRHLGLMHSILALASSNIDYTSPSGRAILAKHPDVTQHSLAQRAQYHQDEAFKEFFLDIKRQEAGGAKSTDSSILSVRYGQMLCFVVMSLTEGKITGEHRVHLQAYQKFIRENPPEDSPFMDFIREYFQFHISVDELVHQPISLPSPSSSTLAISSSAISNTTSSPPSSISTFTDDAADSDLDMTLSTPPTLFQPEAECLLGVQDNLFYFMSSITRLRNKIRINIAHNINPVVDYNCLYLSSQIDASIRAWQSAWPVGEVRHIAGLLYKQMLWVYLYRTIYPPKSTDWAPDSKITSAVAGGLELLRLVPASHPCQTVLLTPAFIIGCAAFEVEQRQPIRESIRRVREYTTLKNADRALEVLEEVWRCMDRRDERSWDWQWIARDMGMDFLAT